MNGTAPEFSRIHDRMEKLEQQNRRLRHGILALAASLIVLVTMGAKIGIKDGHFRQITAGNITIIDASGKELITLGQMEGIGTGLRIYNAMGKRVVGLGVTNNGSGLMIADNDGEPRFGLGMDKEVPSLAITNDQGKKIIGLGGDDQGYGLVIMDGNEVVRAGIGLKKGSSGLALYNNQGQYVRGMVQRPDGSHFSSYADGNGEEIFTK